EPNNEVEKVEKVTKINAKASNNLTTNNSNRWILINIPARSLRLYDKDKCVAMYPVGIGTVNTKTPVGYFKVVEKVVNPTWTDPDDLKVVIPS
ncbi:L,D-transpeptidase, partial [Acinetobacter baumannii]|nr:L,D-transpeptidase [Acinetobacter baumannii]